MVIYFQVVPPEATTETVKLVAISYTDSKQNLAVTAIRNNVVDTCYMDIGLLMETVGSKRQPNIHNALAYFPIEFEVNLLGNKITSVINVKSFQVPVESCDEEDNPNVGTDTSAYSDNESVESSQNKAERKESTQSEDDCSDNEDKSSKHEEESNEDAEEIAKKAEENKPEFSSEESLER